MFMEVKVGFHPLDIDFSSKMKVYYDGVCYLRNYGEFERADEWLNSENYISNQAQMISHENLHLILLEEVSEEACAGLNSIDGFSGYLVPRVNLCKYCGEQVSETESCVATMWCVFHKGCIEKGRESGLIDRITKKLEVTQEFEDGPVVRGRE